ncbi:MAG TPA: nucleotide exchange factor GrpE [Anaerolineaceae bacterium]
MTDHHKKEKRDNEPEAGNPEVKAGEGENSAAAQPQPEEMELLSEDDLEGLKAELEQARAKGAEYFDGWQRERADFANFRRRVERDQAQTYQNLQGSIIKKFLPVLDDLNRALKARPTEGDAAAWASGIELISRKLQAILESEGVQRMPAEAELFDPSRHEAISMEDSSDHQSGQIIEVIQDGYLMGDRVLRPALVRVAR